eukprot:CAMPEP_0198267972 /NCGR_PEP_ID=MMETSP1447-20131203/35307_1 /TAXON_ID=420782 /ORGANISM="Chaetoceros dichaeta, Strain CCMP1751" /LENGTH=651 /DNA_ID=CAMNT_0043958807 /DNA_START=30 /DNA_END=1985 /DNA_ORIENTATION=+
MVLIDSIITRAPIHININKIKISHHYANDEIIVDKPIEKKTARIITYPRNNRKLSLLLLMTRLSVVQLLIVLVLNSTTSPLCSSFTLVSSRVRTPVGGLRSSSSIAASQIAILDGSDLVSLDKFLQSENSPPSIDGRNDGKRLKKTNGKDRTASCSIVTGNLISETNSNKIRVVGIAVNLSSETESLIDNTNIVEINGDNGVRISIYEDSMARIPKSISDHDAISTCAASLVGIHCAIHDPLTQNIVKGVGGSEDEFVMTPAAPGQKKIAIMGSGEYACFLADGMSIIGASVTQVTNTNLKPRTNAPRVSILPPAVGTLSLGFASALGTFDCLVDTLADEADAVDTNYDSFDDVPTDGKSVISLLKEQHGCERYISTLSKSQQILREEGILFGRQKADKHTAQVELSLKNSVGRSIIPPKQFGALTLQKLLDGGIIYKNKKNKSAIWIQTFSFKDFWEYTSWPRDTSGGANVRFGLPVVDELDVVTNQDGSSSEIEEEMINAPTERIPGTPRPPKDEYEGQKNPYILAIDGLDELENVIVSKEKDCILFLSATYCRQCKYIAPQYTRLAREMSEGESDVLIAQTDAGRGKGKLLGNFLNVEAVPAFVLFRQGKVYGDTLSISRLPSKKMNKAIDLLSSGQEWDRVALRELK